MAASSVPVKESATLTRLLAAGAILGSAALVGMVITRPAPQAATIAVEGAPVSRRTVSAAVHSHVATSIDNRRPGEAAYIAGDIPGALDHFQKAVESDPNDPEALNNLGQLLVRTHRAAEAIAYFDRAIQIVPNRWAFHFNRAKAFAEMQNWSQAIAGYREALRIFPDDYATQFNLAKTLQKSGDLAGAIEGFERAIRLAPGQADFHLSHGLALEAAGRPSDATAAYRRYLELAGDAPEADKVKGRIALLEGLQPASR